MKQLKKGLNVPLEDFVYSNIFIACCTVLMTYQTVLMFGGSETTNELLGFVFFSTLCSYSFHWYLGKNDAGDSERMIWVRKFHIIHIVLFFTGLAGAIYFYLSLGHLTPWLLAAVVATFLYSAPKIPHPFFRSLRKVALGKTIFLSFVWMYVTTVLPVVNFENPHGSIQYGFILSRFFFIYAICILFDVRDRDYDRSQGVKSLITYLQPSQVKMLFYFSLLISGAIVLIFFLRDDVLAAISMTVGLIIAAAVYKTATTRFSDMLYYFLLDGLMALPSIIYLLAFNYF